MNTKQYLEKIKSSEVVDFNEFIDLIEQEYNFTNIAFNNGNLHNKNDENQGSAKVFCFALLHNLSKEQTLRCFSQHYASVLNSKAEDKTHLNIRNFIKSGFAGLQIDKQALSFKNK